MNGRKNRNVPMNGATAFKEGWDIQAVPFGKQEMPNARAQWIKDWEAANKAAFESHVKGDER